MLLLDSSTFSSHAKCLFPTVSSPSPPRRHHFYRYKCHHPDGSLDSRPTLTTHRSGISGPIVVARPKRCPQWAKRLHIRLTSSRAVTNRHTSEAQSPAPGTSRFEIGWDILGDKRDLGVGFWVFLFCVRLFVLCLCCA
jgi:hypothetical protein